MGFVRLDQTKRLDSLTAQMSLVGGILQSGVCHEHASAWIKLSALTASLPKCLLLGGNLQSVVCYLQKLAQPSRSNCF